MKEPKMSDYYNYTKGNKIEIGLKPLEVRIEGSLN